MRVGKLTLSVQKTEITRKDSLMFTNGINTGIGQLSNNSLHELSIRSLGFNDGSHLKRKGKERRKQEFRGVQVTLGVT